MKIPTASTDPKTVVHVFEIVSPGVSKILPTRERAMAKMRVSKEFENGRRRKVKVTGDVAKRRLDISDLLVIQIIQSESETKQGNEQKAWSRGELRTAPIDRLSRNIRALCAKNKARADGSRGEYKHCCQHVGSV